MVLVWLIIDYSPNLSNFPAVQYYTVHMMMMASALIFITVYATELLLQIIIIRYASTYVIVGIDMKKDRT